MGKTKLKTPPIREALQTLDKAKLLPVYFFFGEDTYSIESAVKAVEKTAAPLLSSEFDKEVFHGEDKSILTVLDFASAFPFGSGKKLLIYKDFEKAKDKKNLTQYIQAPAEFTILVLIHNGSIANLNTEPYKSLSKAEYIFEAKELKGSALVNWLVEHARSKGKNLTPENAQILIDISSENRSLLENQLEKIFIFLGNEKEITLQAIKLLSTSLKGYTIFDLQNALAKKNKTNALNVAFNLLDNGAEPTFIVHMLTRYFTALSRITELNEKKIPDQEAARIVGTHPYYYKDYKTARKLYTDEKLIQASHALLKADLLIKTTSTNNKTIISLLIAEILH